MYSSPNGKLHRALRMRRVGVCGGTQIRPENAMFCEKLGWEFAGEEGLTIVTGGFKHLIQEPDRPSTDWWVVKGALERLKREGIRADTRIETLLPEKDSAEIIRFRVGKIHVLRNRSLQARRFTLINSVDAVVTVEGSGGTREQIDLALALEKPCLPLPFTRGISSKRWIENREMIQEWFDVDVNTAEILESIDLSSMSEHSNKELANRVKELLLRKLKRRCFVMMPFSSEYLPLYEQSVKLAIVEQGFEAVRTDHLNLVGNVVEVLRGAINSCDCAIAVITEHNPNVMYELGLAHAQGKPVIMLAECDLDEAQFKDLPFDLRNEYVIGYKQDWASLREKISVVLKQVLGASR